MIPIQKDIEAINNEIGNPGDSKHLFKLLILT